MRPSISLLSETLRARLGHGLGGVAKAGVLALMAVAAAATLSGQGPPTSSGGDPAPNSVSAQTRQELRMAGAFLVGKGVAKDPVQAAYWFRKAADEGDPGAQNEMGYLYVWGLGVQRDEAQAVRWFARSAGGGWQQGKLNLAVMYLRGAGVAKDPAFGRQLLLELADKGNARAEDYLGVMYLAGDGVRQDTQTAEAWLSMAAKGKNPEGQYAMGQLYSVAAGHEHDFDKAAKFLRDSAKAGYVPAMYTLGVLLVRHPEVTQKKGEAVSMLERAAEAGTWQSAAALGLLASQGRDGAVDMGRAFRWFTVAGLQGGDEAQAKTRVSLERCRAALSPDEQGREERAAKDWLGQHPHDDLFVFNDVRSEFPVGEIYAMRASAQE